MNGVGIAEEIRLTVPGSDDAPLSDLRTGFRNGFVFELLDIRETQPMEVHVMVLNPQKYELTEPHQTVLTPAGNNTVVDESVGIITRSIMLEGTFGVDDKRATGFDGAQGGGRSASGSTHFKHLKNLFRRYSKLRQDPETSAYVKLIFHALRDDDHFIISKPVFTTPRDVRSNRLHYNYRIQAEAIADATHLSRLRRSSVPLSGDFFTDALRSISEAFNDARAAFAEVNASLGILRGKISNIQTVMINAAQFINAVGNAIQNTTDTLISFPLKLAATITEQVADAADTLATSIVNAVSGPRAEAVRSLQRMEDAFNRIVAFPDRFSSDIEEAVKAYRGELGLTAQDHEDGTAGATVGSLVRVLGGSESSSRSDLSSYSGVLSVKLQATDTLDSLAARYSTSSELIALINDLRPPYIHPGGGPGILQSGDIILIPIREGASSAATQPSADYISADDAVYGVDIAIDMDLLNREGLLDFRDPVRSDAGDFELARGVDNVVQGTSITIYTERGSTVYLPDVGISRNVGRKGTVQHVLLASLNLREAILSDTRISGIRESEIVLDGDVLTQKITPILSGRQRDVTLVLPFGKASGG